MPRRSRMKRVYAVYTGSQTEPTVIGRYKSKAKAKKIAAMSQKAEVVKEYV